MRSACCEKAYQAGIQEGLRQAIREQPRSLDTFRRLGGTDAPYKQTQEWKRQHGG